MKFVFYGKILGYYRELSEDSTTPKVDSPVYPASTLKWFKENARKVYAGEKIVFLKVG